MVMFKLINNVMVFNLPHRIFYAFLLFTTVTSSVLAQTGTLFNNFYSMPSQPWDIEITVESQVWKNN